MKNTISECETTHSGEFRIIQIHPSLQCNLACDHCYSSSAPEYKKKGIEPRALEPFLLYARERGFNVVSLSGGEPFLYKGLEELVAICNSLDFKISLATNAMLLQSERAKRILSAIDLIAVSIDGHKQLHDDIRKLPGAYDKMMQGVEVLRTLGSNFGFIHTVTRRSWISILELAEVVHNAGAKLFQLHPLEMYGRAVKNMNDDALDQNTLHKVFLLRSYLETKYQDTMRIQLDLLHRDYIKSNPAAINIYPEFEHYAVHPFPSIYKNIVIDELGNISPVAYGFSRDFSIGNIHEFHTGKQWFEEFQLRKGTKLQRLFESTYWDIIRDHDSHLVNWNEKVIEASNEMIPEMEVLEYA